MRGLKNDPVGTYPIGMTLTISGRASDISVMLLTEPEAEARWLVQMLH